MTNAINQLQLAIEIAENNFPINMREGKFAQARLERNVARDCRQAITLLEQVKVASFLMPKPTFGDKVRVGGRTALEGGLGGYGGGALMALIMGLIGRGRKVPIPKLNWGLGIGAGAGIGAVAGGVHGFNSAYRNARDRRNPFKRLSKSFGL